MSELPSDVVEMVRAVFAACNDGGHGILPIGGH
jgi:hypothetical protein